MLSASRFGAVFCVWTMMFAGGTRADDAIGTPAKPRVWEYRHKTTPGAPEVLQIRVNLTREPIIPGGTKFKGNLKVTGREKKFEIPDGAYPYSEVTDKNSFAKYIRTMYRFEQVQGSVVGTAGASTPACFDVILIHRDFVDAKDDQEQMSITIIPATCPAPPTPPEEPGNKEVTGSNPCDPDTELLIPAEPN